MPPQLALLLCTGFVLFLLRLDCRQAPDVSSALWLPTVWMLSVGSKPLGVWFGMQDSGADAGSPLDRRFLSLLLCLGLLVLFRKRREVAGGVSASRWPFVLVLYMLASVVWSDTPGIAFRRWVREFLAVVMALVVLSESSPRQGMECLLRRTVYILIPFSILLVKYFPEYGVQFGRWTGDPMWVGVTQQKNGLGRLCLISVFFLIWTFFRRWRKDDTPASKYHGEADIFVFLIALFLLKGPTLQAYSATAVVALSLGVLALAWMVRASRAGKGTNRKFLLFLLGFVILYGVFTPLIMGGAFAQDMASVLGRDATLTGRTDIWAGLVPEAQSRILLGAGIGSFWTETAELAHSIGEAHNGYLDLILDLGAVGLVVVIAMLWSLYCEALASIEIDFFWATLVICFVLMAAVHNCTESSLQSCATHLTAILVFLAITAPAVFGRARASGRN